MPANQSTPEVTRALKPCPNPWCASHEFGEQPYLRKDITTPHQRVACSRCPLVGPAGVDGASAITAWNTRTPARGGDELREARTALRRIAEGNLGDAPWQANYETIKRVAAEALASTDMAGGSTSARPEHDAPPVEGLTSGEGEPVAYVPKGHLERYLKGRNTACWVYGSPTAEDNDVLYLASPKATATASVREDRPDDEALDPHLPESIRAEKRCGIQRSDWMTAWFVPWSPRNDNQNAEGPWSHWVALANAILAADAKAIATLTDSGTAATIGGERA